MAVAAELRTLGSKGALPLPEMAPLTRPNHWHGDSYNEALAMPMVDRSVNGKLTSDVHFRPYFDTIFTVGLVQLGDSGQEK